MKRKQIPFTGLTMLTNDTDAQAHITEKPNAEVFGICVHKSGDARIMSLVKDEWIPIGPQCPSAEGAAILLQRLALKAQMFNLPSLLESIQVVDRSLKASNTPMSDYPDSEWSELMKEQHKLKSAQSDTQTSVTPGTVPTLVMPTVDMPKVNLPESNRINLN